MKAVLREVSRASPQQTLMRMNAIAGGKVIVDLAAEVDYADLMIINLDYEGDGFTPSVVIDTFKWAPGHNPPLMKHHWPLDMSELFGQDKVDHNLLRQVVVDIGFAINELMARS